MAEAQSTEKQLKINQKFEPERGPKIHPKRSPKIEPKGSQITISRGGKNCDFRNDILQFLELVLA